ncbi:hypothetical protein AIOL_000353 [Candidatus Rhodobacter oscarellae]|uniref:Periplasmic heavy metal sensor n=1 Tax=Candidatus Rhodobacter oscarellae TaxID=1675527 RepID=A0A0J9EBP8_9RHOB|nr:periplasmic heavy metal sensor [Candidatus Rhodobacter lobularis]KMW60200.1 hypothetical protein AIOL_000353 [Candidatus Rhodobacter lobularis]
MTEPTPNATPNPAPNPEAVPKRRWPWLKITLFASLAINLLIAGLVAGFVLSGPRDRDRNPIWRDMGLGPFGHALPWADKKALTAAIRAEAGSFRKNREELRRQFEAFLAALRAEPFDADALAVLVKEHRGRITERQELGQRLLLQRITEMSDAERAQYAERLNEMVRRHGQNRR